MGVLADVKQVGVVAALRQSRLSMVYTGLQEIRRMVRPGYWSGLKAHPSGRAVIVVDMLNDFLEKDGTLSAALREGGVKALLAENNRVIEAARRTGIPVVYVCEGHTWNDPEFTKFGFPKHGVRRTWGAQVHPDISQPVRRQEWFFKPAFSGFGNQELAPTLKRLGVKELVLVGVATEFCDKNTALDGLKAGFEVTVVSDAVKPVVPADGVKAIGEMRAAGVKFLTAVEAEQRLADAV